MGNTNTYIMKTWTLQILTSRFGSVRCNFCGRVLEEGDKTVSKKSGAGSRRYHKECYEQLFFDPRVNVHDKT